MHAHILINAQSREQMPQHRHDDDTAANPEQTGGDTRHRAGGKQQRAKEQNLTEIERHDLASRRRPPACPPPAYQPIALGSQVAMVGL